ncbi:MAG: trigger factor [Bacteroidales bacterium]|jgi:FKBP-type peptidyl-prolyl cis-trans isomerase (trigger factor)|nr:trigger factor [Bacteroidales bacterium]
MNITQEATGDLTATVKIEVTKEDYQDQVNKVLKDYQKNANMSGFRPGKVPMGMIKKMYGRAVLAEEINKIISENLNNYLTENEIKTLGHPLPNEDKQKQIDFDTQDTLEFFFDIALQPEINIEINDKIKVNYHKIKVDDKSIDKYIEDLRMKNGKAVETEEGKDGEAKIEPAELNEEFYSAVFPGQDIKDEATFREKLAEQLELSFGHESDRLFMRHVADKLIDTSGLELPDEFMKRWLAESGEAQVKAEDIESHYGEYARALKWQLIESKIVKDHDIQVTPDDVREQIMSYFQTPGEVDEETRKRLNEIADSIMQNQEEVKRIYDQLLDNRMRDLLKSTVKLRNKEVSYDDFIKLATETK